MTTTPGKIVRIGFKALAVFVLAGVAYRLIDLLVDFPTYYLAGRSLLSGSTELYSPEFAGGVLMDYRYPPFFILVFSPLTLLSYPVASYLWLALSFVEIYLCWAVVRRAILSTSGSGPRLARAVGIVALLAVAQYYVKAINFGNAHLLVTLLMFASLYFVMRRRPALAALLMSLAITFKLTPLVLLPYFALKRRWEFLLYTSAFLVLFNLFVPAAFFGFDRNAELLHTWYQHVVVDSEFHELNGPINLSLKGQLRRYFTEVDYTQRHRDQNYPAINIAEFPTKQIDLWWAIVSAATFALSLGVIWWTSFARGRGKKDETQIHESANERGEMSATRARLELGLMICLMLFVGPSTSKIYFIALLWPVACLAHFAFQSSDVKTKFLRYALVSIASINIIAPLLPGSATQRLLLVVGVDFYITLLLLILHAYALIIIRRGQLRAA